MGIVDHFRAFGELRIYTPTYEPIGTVYPVRAVNVGWMRRGVGSATFVLPRASLRFGAAYLRKWNRVEFHHQDMPYVWVGVIIDPGLGEAEATVTCSSLEIIYHNRLTDIDYWSPEDATAGMIAHDLHMQANRQWPLAISIGGGTFYNGGPMYFAQYAANTVAEALDDLAAKSGGEWWVDKEAHDHSLPRFNWAQRRGSDKWADVMCYGDVVDRPELNAAGQEFATDLFVVGAQVGSGSAHLNPYANRLFMRVSSPAARKVYGMLEQKVEFSEVDDDILLAQLAYQELDRRTRDVRSLPFNIDNRRSVWGQFWLGDTIRVILPNVGYTGFDGPVTVEGIQLDVDNGKLGLVTQVV